MDMGTFRGIMTAILMTLFVAVVIWAYSGKRGADFDAASRLPLDDEPDPPADRRSG